MAAENRLGCPYPRAIRHKADVERLPWHAHHDPAPVGLVSLRKYWHGWQIAGAD